jgi:RHS repeat-associated protein
MIPSNQEAASRLNRLKTFDGIDNKGRQADNSDMDATADKDNPSAFSHQPSAQASARIEASVAEYLFYHCDHLGTVRLITDNSGAVVSRHDYEPFGVEIAPTFDTAGNTHKFTGHERDRATGYDYMHYRSYGSNIGRFMKPDDGSAHTAYDPQSWNLYSYVRGNPVNRNDPSGHTDDQTLALKTPSLDVNVQNTEDITPPSPPPSPEQMQQQQLASIKFPRAYARGILCHEQARPPLAEGLHPTSLRTGNLVRNSLNEKALTAIDSQRVNPITGQPGIDTTPEEGVTGKIRTNKNNANVGKFGKTRIEEETGKRKHHPGLDINAPIGTPNVASESGTVTEKGLAGIAGERIVITHADGSKEYHCHLSKYDVKTGDRVDAGQTIGKTGISGNTSKYEPHLHFALIDKNGKRVDPAVWLNDMRFK